MICMRSEKPIKLCVPPRLSEVSTTSPSNVPNGFNVRLTDDGPFASFQGRLSSASSFNASFLQAIDGVMALASCPQVVSSSSTFQTFGEASHLWGLLCPPVYLLDHFPSLRHVQLSTSTGVFESGCRPLTQSSLGFPFHFL